MGKSIFYLLVFFFFLHFSLFAQGGNRDSLNLSTRVINDQQSKTDILQQLAVINIDENKTIIKDYYAVANTCYNLSILYLAIDSFKLALQYCDSSLYYAGLMKTPELVWAIQGTMAHIYSEMGNPGKAVDIYKKIFYEYEIKRKQDAMSLLQVQKIASDAIAREQKTAFKTKVIGGAVLIFIMGLVFYLFKLKKKQNLLLENKNNQIGTLNEELGHRVKNNLMFVSSLMRMQARRLKGAEARIAVKDAENRIEAMAMVHRRLYDQGESRTIEMHGYLNQLGDHLLKSYAAIDNIPVVQLHFEKLVLEADVAVQFGLIVNELMTNSFKHAFKNQNSPLINMHLTKVRDDEIRFVYNDNGVGVPEGFDPKNSNSMGLRLIYDLTDQLNGRVRISNQNGAHFQFEFKDLKTID